MKKLFFALMALILFASGCAAAPQAPLTQDVPAQTPGAQESKLPVEETEPAVLYSNITIDVRRDAVSVSERDITDPEEIRLVEEIVFDYMVKSAAWEGVEASELEDCITLSFDSTDGSARQSYYQYEAEGKRVLQAGETGWYSIMSEGAYEKLMRLAGLPVDSVMSVEEATALLVARFGEKDEDTGNTFSFGYQETLTLDEKEYYLFRISWLVDNDHVSYLTDYIVAADGSEMREYLPEGAGE